MFKKTRLKMKVMKLMPKVTAGLHEKMKLSAEEVKTELTAFFCKHQPDNAEDFGSKIEKDDESLTEFMVLINLYFIHTGKAHTIQKDPVMAAGEIDQLIEEAKTTYTQDDK